MKILNHRVTVLILAIASMAAVFGLGVYVGTTNRPAIEKVFGVDNPTLGQPTSVDFEPFWQAWAILDEKYVDGNGTTTASTTVDVTDTYQERIYGAISGMVDSLGDPYTVFMPPVEKKMFDDDIRGNFGGVGMEVGIRDGVLTVIAPIKNSPAQKAGVMVGDQVVKVEGKSTVGLSVEDGVAMIRGEKGTPVNITFIREGEADPIELTIVRDTIVIPSLETEIITRADKNKIFVIHLHNFGEDSANAFRGALREFINTKTDKLILDLRGNPGGYLEAAVDMASFFLPQGEVIVQEYSGNAKNDNIFRSKGYDVFNDKLKMVILVDQGSASASEILAGALAEHGRATLVGEQTFGKGSVQELVPLTADTSLKITVARWLTPNGNHISKNGLTPEFVVTIDPKDRQAIASKTKADPQLEKAIDILIKK